MGEPIIKQGAVIYCDKLFQSNEAGSPEIYATNGKTIAIVLGQIKPGQRDPSPNEIESLLGRLGYVSLDDVLQALGRDATDRVIDLFKGKYHGKAETISTLPPQ